jgi:hypothetical protein
MTYMEPFIFANGEGNRLDYPGYEWLSVPTDFNSHQRWVDEWCERRYRIQSVEGRDRHA